MGKVKDLIITAEKLATDNFDMGRNEFCALAADTFKGKLSFNIQMRAAVEHYDVIQIEMNAHYNRLDNEYADNRAIKEMQRYGL